MTCSGDPQYVKKIDSYHFVLVVDGGAMTQQQLHDFKMAASSCTLQSCVSTLKKKQLILLKSPHWKPSNIRTVHLYSLLITRESVYYTLFPRGLWGRSFPCWPSIRKQKIPWENWARIFKRLWSPGIDSKEWIPSAYLAWRAGTITLFLLGS